MRKVLVICPKNTKQKQHTRSFVVSTHKPNIEHYIFEQTLNTSNNILNTKLKNRLKLNQKFDWTRLTHTFRSRNSTNAEPWATETASRSKRNEQKIKTTTHTITGTSAELTMNLFSFYVFFFFISSLSFKTYEQSGLLLIETFRVNLRELNNVCETKARKKHELRMKRSTIRAAASTAAVAVVVIAFLLSRLSFK